MNAVRVGDEVRDALARGLPVVALETAVLTHGLPRHFTLGLAQRLEDAVRARGAVPALVGVFDGEPVVGLTHFERDRLVYLREPRKAGAGDLGAIVAARSCAGTTVGGTAVLARLAGIRVFCTGGIGGVHRGDSGDVSGDLWVMAETPIAVVCSGAKSILDIPRTLETLETLGVPVVGLGCTTFPEFYSRGTHALEHCAADVAAVAALCRSHWDGLARSAAVLVANPIPLSHALDADEVAEMTTRACAEAAGLGVAGKELTPFLLGRLNALTGGVSVRSNLALLLHNAERAAELAVALAA